VVVIGEFDKEFDLLLGGRVAFQDRAVGPELRDPVTSARLGDAFQRQSGGQIGVGMSDAHDRGSESAGSRATRRIKSPTLSYGSTTSRKAHRPNPPWLFTAGTQSVRAVAVFASLSFFRSPVTS